MYVIGCTNPNEFGYNSGRLFLYNDLADGGWGATPYEVPLPFGVSAVEAPVSTCNYQGRTYVCGGFTYNMVLDEHFRLWKQGIRPPGPPTISGPGAGNYAIAYLSWYDELTGERSPLSEGTAIASGQRTWTLPTIPIDDTFVSTAAASFTQSTVTGGRSANLAFARPGDRIAPSDIAPAGYHMITDVGVVGANTVLTTDASGVYDVMNPHKVQIIPASRVSHIELWLSVAGGLPSLVMRVAVGSASVVENTAAGDLGEAFTGSFERFPRCSMNVIWNDRQVMAGDPDNPDTIYLSEQYYPERWAAISFRTRSGDPVTGILALRDYLLIFTRSQTYMLQGYSERDFTLTLIEQSLGSIGHLCNRVVHGSAYVWTLNGPYIYNGAWHPLSPENYFTIPTVADSAYVKASVDPTQNMYFVMGTGLALHDKALKNFDTIISGSRSVGAVSDSSAQAYIIGIDYTSVQPEAGGAYAPGKLIIDRQAIYESSYWYSQDYNWQWNCFYNYLSNKWGLGRLYTFSVDPTDLLNLVPAYSAKVYPHMRLTENYQNVPTAIADTKPVFAVLLGHNYYGEAGLSFPEGKTFRDIWLDFRTNNSGSKLILYSGDDDALEMIFGEGCSNLPTTPNTYDIPTYKQNNVGTYLVHNYSVDSVTGRGMSVLITAPDLGLGASFRGFGGVITDGPATRYERAVPLATPKFQIETLLHGTGPYGSGNGSTVVGYSFTEIRNTSIPPSIWIINGREYTTYYNSVSVVFNNDLPKIVPFKLESGEAVGGIRTGALYPPGVNISRVSFDSAPGIGPAAVLQTWHFKPIAHPGILDFDGVNWNLAAGYTIAWSITGGATVINSATPEFDQQLDFTNRSHQDIRISGTFRITYADGSFIQYRFIQSAANGPYV